MPPQPPHAPIRFDAFELDPQTHELRKNGRPIKLQDQPGRLLALLACRAGELVTRAEIEKALWGEGEFVEFEHAVNTAVRKVREALGDDLDKPRYIETLPRKGYRFIAPVESGDSGAETREDPSVGQPMEGTAGGNAARSGPATLAPRLATTGAAAPSDFKLPRPLARWLFLAVQAGYLTMYCAALYYAENVEEVLARLLGGRAGVVAILVLIVAMCGIAVRLYLLSSVGLNHPAAGAKFERLFPALFVLDVLWAVSPLLLVRKIGYGLALGAIVPLAYLPFCQRTLVESTYPKTTLPDSTPNSV